MKDRSVFFLVLTVVMFVLSAEAPGVLNMDSIKKVRAKDVLNGRDLEVIDRFVAEGVLELVTTRDFTSTGKIRGELLANAHSSSDSARAQYEDQFLDSAHRHIADGLQRAAALEPEDRRVKTTINLLILADGLKSARLADLAMAALNDKNEIIRYWAVHCLSNPAVVAQLNANADAKLSTAVTERLRPLVASAGPEILVMIAQFAGTARNPKTDGLLLEVVDTRVNSYINWSVDSELIDGAILKLLAGRITVERQGAPDLGRAFGQLYSCVVQRYVKGMDCLSESSTGQLASVVVGTEQECVAALLGAQQRAIKRAVEQNDNTALLVEHNRLLGDETKTGELPTKLGFDYGKTGQGAESGAPRQVPDPPATFCSAANRSM